MITGAGLLPRRTVEELLAARTEPVSPEGLAAAEPIVRDVRRRGEAAVRAYAEEFGELGPRDSLVVRNPTLCEALAQLTTDERDRLERVAQRIRTFAEAQLAAIRPATVPIPGGRAGHWLAPIELAGCYAPGGRYSLPSTVLMTAITARTAGVDAVWLASPKPARLTLAAAALAGVDGVLAAGGAHAIAALAYGAGSIPPCDLIVGPGNKYVTAAKYLVARDVAIDQYAGPSELVVLADDGADPSLVAADLLAQAEHDPEALPILVTWDQKLAASVNQELHRQLVDLPTAAVARAALAHGGVVVTGSCDEATAVCDALAPEHLELHVRNGGEIAGRLRHYGALFIGADAAEVLGDYGAGPNHVLPTGGSARSAGGLSVLTFLRLRTWMEITDPTAAAGLADDAAWFGKVEGLEAHARSASRRRS